MNNVRYFMDIVSNSLLEYNVINVADVEKKVDELATNIQYDKAKEWFVSAARRYFINDPTTNSRISSLGPNAPEWLQTAHGNGQDLYRWAPTSTSLSRLQHVVDWLNSLYLTAQETIDPQDKHAAKFIRLQNLAKKYLSNLNALDIKKLIAEQGEKERHHVEDWFKELSSIADEKEDIAGIEDYITYSNGYRWVNVKSKASLTREGKLMQHCVGTYSDKVEKNKAQIYSLRDQNNQPHCTIEVENNEINQVKGKQNAPPVAKYAPYVKDFLNKIKIKATYYGKNDIERTGLAYDEKTNAYGTLRDLSELLATLPDGLEIIRTPKNVIHMWFKTYDYGVIEINDYESNNKIVAHIEPNRVHNDDTKNQAMQKDIVKDAIFWLNETYKDKKIVVDGKAEGLGYHTHENKITHITDISPIDEFEHTKLIRSSQKYYDDSYSFVSKADGNVVMRFSSDFRLLTSTIPDYLMPDVIEFLNKYVPKETSEKTAIDYANNNIVYNDGKWEPIKEASTVVKKWGDGGIYEFPYNNTKIVRIYDDNGNPLLNMTLNNRGNVSDIKHFSIKNVGIAKHAKDLIDFINDNNVTTLAAYGADFVKEMKKYGIIYSKNKWSIAKTVGKVADPEGFSMRAVGTKTLVIIKPDGSKGGEATRFDKDTIQSLTINDKESASYIARYSAANPNVSFLSRINTDGYNIFRLGYFVNNLQFVKISDTFPTKKIADSGHYVWKRKAYILVDTVPIENRWGLYDGENKVVLIVDANENKTITNIIPIIERKSSVITEETVAPYIDDLNVLIKTTNAVFPKNILAKANLEIKDDVISLIASSGKVRAFTEGKIVYEDGHAWLRSDYNKSEWHLLPDIEQKYSHILECKIENGSISQVKFNRKYKDNKKLYRQYLNDMLDILDDMD